MDWATAVRRLWWVWKGRNSVCKLFFLWSVDMKWFTDVLTECDCFLHLRGMFEMNCLFLSGDFKFQVSPKVLISCPRSTPVARNAKFQPMYPLLEGVTVRWFGHSNKVLMNGRSKCLSGLVFPPSKECFQFRKQKEITWGKVWGIRGVRQISYFFFLQKRCNYCGGMSWGIVM